MRGGQKSLPFFFQAPGSGFSTVREKAWIPAFAGMTTGGHPRESGGPAVADGGR
jgi:hypothetical protein